MRLGIVKVLTRTEPEAINNHGRLIEGLFPDIEAFSRCIEDQPQGIFDDATLERAEPKIVQLAAEMEREGADGIFISCAADPAVAMVRSTAKIPVLGAGSGAALTALAFERPVGLLGLAEVSAPAAMVAVLGTRLMGSTSPQGVVTALDLARPGAEESFVAAVEDLRERGAGVIALACTGFATLGVAPRLSKRAGIPIIDPVVASAFLIRSMMESDSGRRR